MADQGKRLKKAPKEVDADPRDGVSPCHYSPPFTMLENGWIKLHRSITTWGWYTHPATRVVFEHLLLTANLEPREWMGKSIERGQRITTLRKLAVDTGLSVRSVRTAIEHLKSTHEITHSPQANYTLFTVVKFNEYQMTDTDSDTRPTHDRHTTDTKGRMQESKNTFSKEKVVVKKFTTPATTELAVIQKEPTPANTLAEFLDQAKSRSGTLYEKSVGYFSNKGIANPASEIAKFCNYWTERTADGKRQRWQKEKVFELSRRLATWATRAANDRPNGKPKEQWQAVEDLATAAAINQAFKPQTHA